MVGRNPTIDLIPKITMSLEEDLVKIVRSTFAEQWTVEATTSVPAPENLTLNANHAKDLQTATVLYADLDGSTSMVDSRSWDFSAEVYKNYLRCSALIIKSEAGIITAYDGDRIMAVFTGSDKNTRAVRTALKINHAVHYIINPALKNQYPNSGFEVKHVIGIDSSQLRAARIGVRGDSDIVWIGRAANYAAKLTSLPAQFIWITKAVYDSLHESTIFSLEKINMWEARSWTAMNNQTIYRSNFHWSAID